MGSIYSSLHYDLEDILVENPEQQEIAYSDREIYPDNEHEEESSSEDENSNCPEKLSVNETSPRLTPEPKEDSVIYIITDGRQIKAYSSTIKRAKEYIRESINKQVPNNRVTWNEENGDENNWHVMTYKRGESDMPDKCKEVLCCHTIARISSIDE